MIDPRIQNLSKVLTTYSTGIKEGDTVIIEANTLSEQLVKELYRETLRLKAHCTVRLSYPELNEIFFETANKEQLSYNSPIKIEEYKKADVVFQILSEHNPKALSNIPPEKKQLYSQANAELSAIMLKRVGEGSLKLCITAFPTNSAAQEAELSLSEYEKFFFEACFLNEDDPVEKWKQIDKEQERLITILESHNDFHILSKDTDIKFSAKNRKWVNCSGKINFPDGEIFTGPIEDSVEGKIRFTYPGIFQGSEIEDICLTFSKGKVIEAEAKKGNTLLQSVLNTDEGARYVGEIAIATNYGIQRFTKNMLFDEKIGGTIHLAIGTSIPQSGGKNVSAIHWDMLCSMKEQGQIFADGKLIYEKGNFLI